MTVGGTTYVVTASPRGSRWAAEARRADNGDRFGIECTGDTEAEAVESLERWLNWQREHAAALEALQRAEQDYHRTLAGSAFASATEGPSAVELQKESLEEVEAARLRLDDVRARRPN